MLNSNSKQQVSREDLKRQLEGIQSFDISSFGQSKNSASNNLRGLIHNNQSLFPRVDAPTLELLEDSQYNIRYLDKLQNKPKQKAKKKLINTNESRQDQYQDLTARNSQANNTYYYEHKLQQMQRQMQRMVQKLQGQRKQKQLLHQKISLMQMRNSKVIEEYKEKNKQLKEQIKLLKDREIKAVRQKQAMQKQLNNKLLIQKTPQSYISRQSRVGSVSSLSGNNNNINSNTNNNNSIHSSNVQMTSYMQDPSCFCPELLSPEETVILLGKLLKKVSKSSKMIKELTNDVSVKAILSKIEKK